MRIGIFLFWLCPVECSQVAKAAQNKTGLKTRKRCDISVIPLPPPENVGLKDSLFKRL